jgi:hypothetical protein
MFTIRPIMLHFVLWVVLAPLFVLEAQALDQLLQTMALQDALRVRMALAEVTAERVGTRGPELRYEFWAAGGQRVAAMNTSGWGETWIPVSDETWQHAQQHKQINVIYLPEHPEANQPIGRVGSPIGDSAFSWGFFLLADLVWLAETIMIAANFLRCQIAAERRIPTRIRFWRTIPVPVSIHW